MQGTSLPHLDKYIADCQNQFVDWLSQLVAVPTVSADPARSADIKRGAKLAIDLLEKAGLKTQLVATEGNPVVFGELIQNPSYPTVLLYNHLDVQPAASDEWATEPFRLIIDSDKYYGRGATDDKGPALTALFAIMYARDHHLPLNFKIAWETEEEIGSPHFEAFVKTHVKELAADSVIVADTIWVANDRPTIPTGLRGLITFEVTLRTAAKETHSGLAGGVARNPLGELAQIISECYDATSGDVKVPGFYDDVRPISDQELNSLLTSGFKVKHFMRDHELSSLRTEDPSEVLKRIMAEPTFEVHGLTGGYNGPGVKTAIPAEATAKLSSRLVPGQDPRKIFQLLRDFILKNHPDVHIQLEAAAQPYLVDVNGPYAQAAESAAIFAFGSAPVFVREGGSIGSVVSMASYLKAPVMLLGLSLPEHGYHAPNEYFDWQQAAGGIKYFAKYFAELAKMPHRQT